MYFNQPIFLRLALLSNRLLIQLNKKYIYVRVTLVLNNYPPKVFKVEDILSNLLRNNKR